MLRELEFEHSADRGLILEILPPTWARLPDTGMEMLGYLLRSFFENYRRHSAGSGPFTRLSERTLLAARTEAA